MASTSETGLGKNVANLDVEISSAQGIGKDYLPANPLLKIESMLKLSSNCKMFRSSMDYTS